MITQNDKKQEYNMHGPKLSANLISLYLLQSHFLGFTSEEQLKRGFMRQGIPHKQK